MYVPSKKTWAANKFIKLCRLILPRFPILRFGIISFVIYCHRCCCRHYFFVSVWSLAIGSPIWRTRSRHGVIESFSVKELSFAVSEEVKICRGEIKFCCEETKFCREEIKFFRQKEINFYREEIKFGREEVNFCREEVNFCRTLLGHRKTQ